jgi:hypothetical protein
MMAYVAGIPIEESALSFLPKSAIAGGRGRLNLRQYRLGASRKASRVVLLGGGR